MIVCDEITGTARDMEPGVVVEAQASKFFGRHFRCCHGDTKHRFEHELAQFLNARFRPGKEIEAALEHLCLRVVRRRGVSILLCLPGQKQLFELAIQSIARLQPGVADGHSESGGELHETPYPYRLSLALASMNRIIANTRISEVTDRTTDHFVRHMRREKRHPAGHRRPGVIAVAIGRLQLPGARIPVDRPQPPFVEAQHAGTLEPCIGLASLRAIHREPRSTWKVLGWDMTVLLHDRTPSARLNVQLGELRSADAVQARNHGRGLAQNEALEFACSRVG